MKMHISIMNQQPEEPPCNQCVCYIHGNVLERITLALLQGVRQCCCRSFFQKMEEAGLMGNLVRLSDYMLTNALAQHAIDTSVALLSSLQPNGLNRVGHFASMHCKLYEGMLMY